MLNDIFKKSDLHILFYLDFSEYNYIIHIWFFVAIWYKTKHIIQWEVYVISTVSNAFIILLNSDSYSIFVRVNVVMYNDNPLNVIQLSVSVIIKL